ncbi:hypothetical protein TorRG33x02_104880 [Trema orientale]|uniref:Uncharacterized protein n=1 Tax=Trema orientale TaxID=63057 RepID=A0A2P5F7M0_TREOI|nr:hypothetical protein TorRG33x02_104880 [Trema orientale]
MFVRMAMLQNGFPYAASLLFHAGSLVGCSPGNNYISYKCHNQKKFPYMSWKTEPCELSNSYVLLQIPNQPNSLHSHLFRRLRELSRNLFIFI